MNVHGKPSPQPELLGWLVEQQVPKTRPRTLAALCEFINQFELQDRYGEAADCLRSNSSQGVKMWLRSVLDPSISWYVNRDEVDWEPSRIAESEGNLWSNLRKIYLFCSYPGIPSPLTTVP